MGYTDLPKWGDAQKFIEALTGDKDTPMVFAAKLPGGGGMKHYYGPLEDHFKALEAANLAGAQIYYGLNELDPERGVVNGRIKRTAENISRVRAVAIDFDNPKASRAELDKLIDAIRQIGIAPSAIVITAASLCRLQVIWCVRGLPPNMFSVLQKGLIDKFTNEFGVDGIDPAIHDLPRLLRLPGTIRHAGTKDNAAPQLTRLSNLTGKVYTPKDIATLVRPSAAERGPTRPALEREPSARRVGPRPAIEDSTASLAAPINRFTVSPDDVASKRKAVSLLLHLSTMKLSDGTYWCAQYQNWRDVGFAIGNACTDRALKLRLFTLFSSTYDKPTRRYRRVTSENQTSAMEDRVDDCRAFLDELERNPRNPKLPSIGFKHLFETAEAGGWDYEKIVQGDARNAAPQPITAKPLSAQEKILANREAYARLTKLVSMPDVLPKDATSKMPDTISRKKKVEGTESSKTITSFKCTERNIRAILDHYEVVVAFDVIRNCVVTNLDECAGSNDVIKGVAHKIDEYFMQLSGTLAGASLQRISEKIALIADKNPINPITGWLDSTTWDGVPRIQQLADCVVPNYDGEASKKYLDRIRDAVIRIIFIQAVAAADHGERALAINPRIKAQFEIVPILQGVQGLGKTKFLDAILPPHLKNGGYLGEGLMLTGGKDDVLSALSVWIGELSELDASMTRNNVAYIKSFLSRKADLIRRPYATEARSYERRTAYMATVNPSRFLHDKTGWRRFPTTPVDYIDLDALEAIDINQVWAEAWARYCGGEKWFLSKEEERLVEKHQTGFTIQSGETDIFTSALANYDWNSMPVQPFYRWEDLRSSSHRRALQLGMRIMTTAQIRDELIYRQNMPTSLSTDHRAISALEDALYAVNRWGSNKPRQATKKVGAAGSATLWLMPPAPPVSREDFSNNPT